MQDENYDKFKKSIVPVEDQNKIEILNYDEHIRPDTSMQSLASLEPSFSKIAANQGFNEVAILKYPEVERIKHVHHAGNSSGIVDGAAAVLLGNEDIGKKYGLKRARKAQQYSKR